MFLLGVKASTDLNSLPEGYVYLANPPNGNGPTIRKTTLQYPYSDVLVRWLGTYTIGGSTWWLVLVMPVPLEWDWGCRVYRFFRRAALNFPARLRGPWSFRAFAAAFPAVAAQIPPAGLATLAGEDPAGRVLADYRPTDLQCTNDVEPDPSTVFFDS